MKLLSGGIHIYTILVRFTKYSCSGLDVTGNVISVGKSREICGFLSSLDHLDSHINVIQVASVLTKSVKRTVDMRPALQLSQEETA